MNTAKRKANEYLRSWVSTAYDRTKSKEPHRYIKHKDLKVKLMLEHKKIISIRYKEKKVKITNKDLNKTQLKAIKYIQENKDWSNQVTINQFEKKKNNNPLF